MPLNRPVLAALAADLRNPAAWRDEIRWDYTQSGLLNINDTRNVIHQGACGCALLVFEWRHAPKDAPWSSDARMAYLGLNEQQYGDIFFYVNNALGRAMADVTPADVAAAIESILAKE